MGTLHKLPKASPLAMELRPVVERLREIAADAYNSLLLADGPPHPDHKLLELAGNALELMRAQDAARKRWDAFAVGIPGARNDTHRQHWLALSDAAYAFKRPVSQALRAAGKLQATTPAGIYAKALLVRHSRTGAALLAKSMAEDLVACQPLRESLWPAQRAGEPA